MEQRTPVLRKPHTQDEVSRLWGMRRKMASLESRIEQTEQQVTDESGIPAPADHGWLDWPTTLGGQWAEKYIEFWFEPSVIPPGTPQGQWHPITLQAFQLPSPMPQNYLGGYIVLDFWIEFIRLFGSRNGWASVGINQPNAAHHPQIAERVIKKFRLPSGRPGGPQIGPMTGVPGSYVGRPVLMTAWSNWWREVTLWVKNWGPSFGATTGRMMILINYLELSEAAPTFG